MTARWVFWAGVVLEVAGLAGIAWRWRRGAA
jgi:hypothetical protein